MPTIGKLLAGATLFAWAWTNAAQADVEIPVVGRPSPFYGAAGKDVKVETTALPADLTIDESILFTIRISKLLNAPDVERPDLAAIEEFRRDFQIEDEPTSESEPAGTRLFRYRLRPRQTTITSIPGIVFPYYDPNLPQPADRPDFPFRKARAGAIAIRVRAAAAPPLKIVPLDVPAFAESLGEPSANVPAWIWWLAVAGPPILAVGWCVVWRTLNPVGHRLVRRRRSRAARIALRKLRTRSRHPLADSGAIVDCIAVYLAERFDLPGVYRTPSDLALHLRATSASEATIAACQEFLQAADAARFTPSPTDSGEALAADAERLILRLEGES